MYDKTILENLSKIINDIFQKTQFEKDFQSCFKKFNWGQANYAKKAVHLFLHVYHVLSGKCFYTFIYSGNGYVTRQIDSEAPKKLHKPEVLPLSCLRV